MSYRAFHRNGDEVRKGEEIQAKWDKSVWTFQSVTHPRKVYVSQKRDPNGPSTWPNMAKQEFYASVFDLGIWDDQLKIWTFEL